MNDTMNQKEKIMGFAYVFLLFATTTTLCCVLLFYYNSGFRAFSQKDFVIVKMNRIKEYQQAQSQISTSVDSLFNKIGSFNPGIKATYEKNDIEFMISDLKSMYENHPKDIRYKSFLHISEFYNMWFIDKEELWIKRTNVERFKRNLEECELGLKNKKDELNLATKK